MNGQENKKFGIMKIADRLELYQLVFIIMKLCNVINWEWECVMIPTIIIISHYITVWILDMLFKIKSKKNSTRLSDACLSEGEENSYSINLKKYLVPAIHTRAKRIEDNEWILINGSYDIENNTSIAFVKKDDSDTIVEIKVKTDSITRSFGKFDKNGDDIYVGDIMLISGYYGYCLVKYDNCSSKYMFDCELGSYSLEEINNEDIEVVSNFIDNPEFLYWKVI